MADEVSHTSNPQKLAHHESPSNPAKVSPHFLYKATLVTAFLVLLPFFPSMAPDFINQTLHARSWELLQLIFVGIAVSYGLFSKKNDDEPEKLDHGSKLDNAHSYVSKLLQVSSVFDDETDLIEENKIQTLMNSKYYRGEPLVLVANEEGPVVKEEESVASEISQKPLLLPVRSLKHRVSDVDLVDESGRGNGLMNRSGSKRFTGNSRKPKNIEVGGLNFQKMEEELEESLVLRSPIPWRSRSGRMEMRENGDSPSPSILSTPTSEEQEQEPEPETELNRAEYSKSLRSSRPNSSFSSISPPKKKLSPSTSFSSESQVMRKKSFSSPPPAPPPPPTTLRKSVLMKSNSTVVNNAVSPEKKVLRRSARSVPSEEFSESELGVRSTTQNDGLLKSVRTIRPSSNNLEKNSMDCEASFVERKGYVDKMINVKKLEANDEFVSVETSDDDEEESEDDYFEGSLGNESGEGATHDNNNNNNNSSVNEVGPDVDKKADEFIAKFREQIRLQRIESIRKSTAQRSGNTLR